MKKKTLAEILAAAGYDFGYTIIEKGVMALKIWLNEREFWTFQNAGGSLLAKLDGVELFCPCLGNGLICLTLSPAGKGFLDFWIDRGELVVRLNGEEIWREYK